jgi:hypothetical protein
MRRQMQKYRQRKGEVERADIACPNLFQALA